MRPSTADPIPTGLTLLEVTLALAVAGLILTGVHAIAVTTFELTAEIDEDRRLAARKGAFLHLVERELRELPAEAAVTLEETGESGTGDVALVIRDAPGAFAFRRAGGHDVVELRGETGSGGAKRLRLVYHAAGEEIASLVLLRDLRQCEWRMRESSLSDWQPAWTDGLSRPRLVELQMAFSGDTPDRHVFWIPRLVPNAFTAPP